MAVSSTTDTFIVASVPVPDEKLDHRLLQTPYPTAAAIPSQINPFPDLSPATRPSDWIVTWFLAQFLDLVSA